MMIEARQRLRQMSAVGKRFGLRWLATMQKLMLCIEKEAATQRTRRRETDKNLSTQPRGKKAQKENDSPTNSFKKS
jgi:hypothetical protein